MPEKSKSKKQKIGKKSKKHNNKTEDEEPVHHMVYQKFMKFMDIRRVKLLKQKLSEFYGKNFAIDYKHSYGFQQQWQEVVSQEKKNLEYIYQENKMEFLFSILLILVFAMAIWFSNVDFFFCQKTITISYQIAYGLGITAILGDFSLSIFKLHRIQYKQITIYQIIKEHYMDIISAFYFALKIFIIPHRSNMMWVLFEIVVTAFIYGKLKNIYGSLRLITFSLNIEYQAKITDMILTLITIMHIVSVILISSTYAGYQVTWISNINIDLTNEFLLYLYSFYFGSTTVLTVGYGDITAKNAMEVLVIVLVQIFGIVMYAYIINEIGYSISNMRKERQLIEKDLSTMQKIKKYYNMDKQTINRARNYIITHKPTFQYLDPEEETRLMLKFNQELRQDITQKNNLSIIKSSLFYLIRWSKTFQQAAAIKLTHILFFPNELIYQPGGKQRIYIFRTGKVNIYAEKNGHKKGINNLLKMIQAGLHKQVSDNCYGFSSVISTRPTNLYAYARKFTSAYFLDKSHFKEAIAQRMDDFQYYHELKSKMDQQQFPETLEIPTLSSTKHHYNPTKTVIIRKNTKKSNKPTNNRQDYVRREKISGQKRSILDENSYIKQMIRTNIEKYQQSQLELVYEERQDNQNNSQTSLQSNKRLKQKTSIKTNLTIPDDEDNIFNHFQSGKQYGNFFVKSNRSKVILKLERENSYLDRQDNSNKSQLPALQQTKVIKQNQTHIKTTTISECIQ